MRPFSCAACRPLRDLDSRSQDLPSRGRACAAPSNHRGSRDRPIPSRDRSGRARCRRSKPEPRWDDSPPRSTRASCSSRAASAGSALNSLRKISTQRNDPAAYRALCKPIPSRPRPASRPDGNDRRRARPEISRRTAGRRTQRERFGVGHVDERAAGGTLLLRNVGGLRHLRPSSTRDFAEQRQTQQFRKSYNMIELQVSRERAGLRLDRFLALELPDFRARVCKR